MSVQQTAKPSFRKNLFSQKHLHTWIVLLVILQPVIDMDYLFYDFLDKFGLPRFSTVIRFLILPGLIIWSFLAHEKQKKKVLWIAVIYGVCFGVYFLLHCRQCAAILLALDLTDNFKFSVWQELTYVLTLAIPFGITYVCYNEHFELPDLKFITLFTSGVISFPILIGDLFVFGKSTYYGYTVANIFSWFSGIYSYYHPRTLASKFFFNEGNTVGILLFLVLPLMYYFFAKSGSRRERIWIGVMIAVQSLSMQILATRVATYGAVLIPLVFLVLYFISCRFLKEQKFLKSVLIYCLCAAAVFGTILNWSPAVENQRVDNKNDVALLHNGAVSLGLEELKNAEDLIPGTAEYINFYVFMFETYGIHARYIQSVPSMYYVEYYSYQHDPKFWVDVTFMPVFDRVSGRQVETIFFNYKYQKLSTVQKVFGFGYSTFMNGSIVLEQDFKQQLYTLGYAGELLCCAPWIAVALYGVYEILRNFRKLISLEVLCLAFSFAAALGASWLSGHTLDQFMTTTFMALITAMLLNRIRDQKAKAGR